MSSRRRPNTKQALDSILNADNYNEALQRLNRTLARAWAAGADVGWGVATDFHTDESESDQLPRTPT